MSCDQPFPPQVDKQSEGSVDWRTVEGLIEETPAVPRRLSVSTFN